MLKRIYVWEVPVRLTHWINVLGIAVLSVTGYYIGSPFLYATSSEQHIMSTMRFLHFVSAYVLMVSVLVRIYWAFVGNRHAHWDELVPVTKDRWDRVGQAAQFYLFLRKMPPKAIGHSALAGVTYVSVFVLFLVEIVSGFALYSQSHSGVLWTLLGGWLLSVMHVQTIRLVHHVVMWLLLAFTVIHVYIAWMLDSVEKNGLMQSIFSGYKTLDE